MGVCFYVKWLFHALNCIPIIPYGFSLVLATARIIYVAIVSFVLGKDLVLSLKTLIVATYTGVAPVEGTGSTMSDDDNDENENSETNLFDGNLDGPDSMGFGPLMTETERSLMERVRQELKHELKQVLLLYQYLFL